MLTIGRKRKTLFPLSISGRNILYANGKPFIAIGDAGWTMTQQLTTAQRRTGYLDVRRGQGFNCILVEAIEKLQSSQTPSYNDQAGNPPFNVMSPVAFPNRNASYWANFWAAMGDLADRNMVAFVCYAYAGFNNNAAGEGWVGDTDAASDADLLNFGVYLETNNVRKNIIWVGMGDYAGTTGQRDKNRKIAEGIFSINANALFMGHPARTDSDGYSLWGPGGQNYAEYNINTVYATPADIVAESATAYGRGAVPVINIEGYYENEHSMTANQLAVQTWQSYCSGCRGFIYGIYPVWGFGEPNYNGGAGPQDALDNYMSTAGAAIMTYVAQMARAYDFSLLVPKTDTSVVTTALGSNEAATCPARASDGSFVFIAKNSASAITVDKACMASNFRARWFDPTNGTFATPAEGQVHSNSGTQAFAHPGNNSVGSTARVLVLD